MSFHRPKNYLRFELQLSMHYPIFRTQYAVCTIIYMTKRSCYMPTLPANARQFSADDAVLGETRRESTNRKNSLAQAPLRPLRYIENRNGDSFR